MESGGRALGLEQRVIRAGGSRLRVPVLPYDPEDGAPELWPSVGEYPIYDPLLYHILSHDTVRVRAYQAAIHRLAPGKVVLDLGTGADLNWALACLEAGARRVYAIEEMPESFAEARAKLEALGLHGKVELIPGVSTAVELPERVDLCVSEILGHIAGSEGLVAVLRDARQRFVAPDGAMVPSWCATRVAACSLPDALAAEPGFGETAASYLETLFSSVGHAFDVRLCLRNHDRSDLLSAPAHLEEIDLDDLPPPETRRSIRLDIERPGRLDGLLLWLELECHAGGERIDALAGEVSWLPVFFPLFHPGVAVGPGDRLELACETTLSDDGRHPEYRLEGLLAGAAGAARRFSFVSPYRAQVLGQNAFYAALFGCRESAGGT